MLLCAVFFVACASPPTPPYPLNLLTIEAPTGAPAGDDIHIVVYGESAQDGTPVGLMIAGKNGPRAMHSTFSEGVARFIIPATYTQSRGYLALIAASGESYSEASIMLYRRASVAAVGIKL